LLLLFSIGLDDSQFLRRVLLPHHKQVSESCALNDLLEDKLLIWVFLLAVHSVGQEQIVIILLLLSLCQPDQLLD